MTNTCFCVSICGTKRGKGGKIMEYLTKEQRKSMEARLAALEASRASLSESLAEEIKVRFTHFMKG